ncbi:MAG: ROK family protein [Methylacidiphilales bacterium]|nr:ROK family protein [Candidatus Methylacidiphilales bacterium]
MILAADFGGTTIKLGFVRDGGVCARARLDACADHPMSERLEAVAGAWETLLKEKGFTLQDCSGAALALPFLTDPKLQRVLGEFEKFPGAPEIDFAAWGKERLGLPVVLENDLRMALLGEWAAGAARGKNDVVMLALGTGIGCAALSDGRLFRGANNRAATLFGHSTLAWDGAAGRCGNIGCAEDLASTATLPQRAKARRDFAGSALEGAKKIDFETLFAFANRGDACSRSLLGECLKVWAVVVQNAVLAYDPEVVVLGGGVLRSRDIVLPAIEQHLHRRMAGLPLQIPVVGASLGDDAALIGCEVLFKQTHPARLS